MSELIYAVDEPDSTFYVLSRRGHFVAAADWPHPLQKAYPDAVFAGTLGSESLRTIIPAVPPSDYHNRADLYQALLDRLPSETVG